MIKIQNISLQNQNDITSPQLEQFKIKQSKILPYQNQSVHAFYQVEVSQNVCPIQEKSQTINIETRLCRLETSSKQYPRIVKEVDIKLANGQVISLRDIFTTLPKEISCKSEQILIGSHSSLLNAPYYQQQQQQQQQCQSYQQPEQVEEESTFEAKLENNEHSKHNLLHCSNRCNSSSVFNQQLTSEIELLSLKLNQLPLLPAAAGALNQALASIIAKPMNISMPMPSPQTIPSIAVAKKNENQLSLRIPTNQFNAVKITTSNKSQQQQSQQQQKGVGEEGTEGGAAASTGSSTTESTSTDSASTMGDKDGDFIVGKVGKVGKKDIFRVVRKNIRKNRNN